MASTVRAIYRDGAIVPSEPVDLAEGAELRVTIDDTGSKPSTTADIDELIRLMESLPLEVDDAEFSGADHDAVLYPRNGDP
ncbi:MAG: antitoxin family protein [Chloroflexota bacterium]